MAFPKHVRIAMFKRDHATCQNCYVRWGDGWMLQAAHYEDGKHRPMCNDIQAGRMLCISCHTEEHRKMLRLATRRNDREEVRRHKYAVQQLEHTNPKRYVFTGEKQLNLPLGV